MTGPTIPPVLHHFDRRPVHGSMAACGFVATATGVPADGRLSYCRACMQALKERRQPARRIVVAETRSL